MLSDEVKYVERKVVLGSFVLRDTPAPGGSAFYNTADSGEAILSRERKRKNEKCVRLFRE